MTTTKFAKLMQTIPVPDGFTAEMSTDTSSSRPVQRYTIKSADVEIVFDETGGGHTRFRIGNSWKTFDRRGVEDSFYWLQLFDTHKVKAPAELLPEQLLRIEKSRDYFKTAIAVPGLPFNVSPVELLALKAQLAKFGVVTFTPSGFGTGYMVTKKSNRYSKQASLELEKFLEHSPLYFHTFDAD